MSVPAVRPGRIWRAERLARGRGLDLSMLGLAVMALLVLVALFAPLLAPQNPNAIHLDATLLDPGSGHLLGTDLEGRDILSRLIVGARTSLGGATVVVVLSSLIGIPLGAIGGLVGGTIDGVLARVWDVLLGFPALLLAILIVATFGRGLWTAAIAISVVYVPLMARVTRGYTLVERERAYVSALRLQGFGRIRILARHIMPNIRPGLVSQLTLNFGYALLDLAALSFIGLGVQPPTSDWGSMLTDAKSTMLESFNPVIWPALALIVTILAVNLVGERFADRTPGSRR